jgi:hypothetical protein
MEMKAVLRVTIDLKQTKHIYIHIIRLINRSIPSQFIKPLFGKLYIFIL